MFKNKKLIVANWKMSFLNLHDAKTQAEKIRRAVSRLSKIQTIIAPSFLHIVPLYKKSEKVLFASQDVSTKLEGSATGEVSAKMLKDVGCEFVIAGHSERRAMGETDKIVAEKVANVLVEGLKPIICIGEKSRDSEGNYLNELKDQILNSMAKVKNCDMLDIVIAYEPVFAIGGSVALAVDEIHSTAIFIRKVLAEQYGNDLAHSVVILYGGTVNLSNASGIIRDAMIDGLLIGRASTTPDFVDLLKSVEKNID
jgi:triosephosphate isomerase